MIKVVIIEDEAPARRKLMRFLQDLEEPVKVIKEFISVEESISFLNQPQDIDLVLSDIELQDGNAFEIFSEIKLSCPVIFTTAYDQFYINAFETNGIDYLLKPFSFERFQKAWRKFLLLRGNLVESSLLINKIEALMAFQKAEIKEYKQRFTVSSGKKMYFINIQDVLFLAAEDGVVIATDYHRKKHILSFSTLKEIEALIDPVQFFRINRSHVINKNFIERVERYSKSTLAIKIKGIDQHLVTSQSATPSFRQWVEL